MARTLGLLVVLVAALGCKDRTKAKAQPEKVEARVPGPVGTVPRASGKLAQLEAAMCACKDAACAERVADEMAAWSKEAAPSGGAAPAMTEEMSRCMDAAMAGGTEASDDAEQVVAKMTELKDRMCECKDTACATKVNEDMTAWSQAMEKGGAAPRMTEADSEKVAAIGTELGKCMQTAMSEALDLTR